jgi:transcriptional regulator with XRE-family HTH domain
MDDVVIAGGTGLESGRSLKTWRALRRIKQAGVAELLGVSQGTISRWENGLLSPSGAEEVAIRRLMAARLESAADHQLGRLVSQSSQPMHLICDLTHRLLAWSPARARDCGRAGDNLIGSSLWPYASDALREIEGRLPDLGWYQPAPPAIDGVTGANRARRLRIKPGRFRFTRFQLSDGSFARLVETLPRQDLGGRIVG